MALSHGAVQQFSGLTQLQAFTGSFVGFNFRHKRILTKIKKVTELILLR